MNDVPMPPRPGFAFSPMWMQNGRPEASTACQNGSISFEA